MLFNNCKHRLAKKTLFFNCLKCFLGFQINSARFCYFFLTDYRDKCPSGWLPFEAFCYLFVTKSNGKWEEFPLKCNDENGLLAMPKTDKELKFLKHKISSSKHRKRYFYIGLKKKSENWTWIDDVPYTRDVHVKDESGDKKCAALSKDNVHMVTCSEPKAGYICEIRTGYTFSCDFLSLSAMTEK